jgi:c-di-GMP-binding flagellar brake protein YcgR
MPESIQHEERRQHKRSLVSSGVIAVLITSAPEVIGAVSDISLGGVKVTYHNPKNREIDFAKLKLDLISDDRFVEAIPCNNVWDHALETSDFIAAGDLRQCGIQFEALNPNQLFLLRGFINRCALEGVNQENHLEIPTPSNH